MTHDLVIIDDNEATVQSLARTIPWERLGCRLAGTAFDGAKGQALILEKRPEIILTDIKMPGMDGLQMIALSRQHVPEAKVIVITGYDEFQYASRAIKLAVFDYILKPVDDVELEKSVRRAAACLDKEAETTGQLEQMQSLNKRMQILTLLTSAQPQDEGISAMLTARGISFDGYFILVGSCPEGISQPMLRRLDEMDLAKGTQLLSLVVDGCLVILVMWLGQRENWRRDAQRLAGRLLDLQPGLRLGVSDCHTPCDEIRQAYQEAKQLILEGRLYNLKEPACFFGQAPLPRPARVADLERVCLELAQSPLKGQARLEEALKAMAAHTRGDARSIRIMLMLYSTQLLRQQLPFAHWADAMDAVVYGIDNATTLSDASRCLTRFYEVLEEALADGSLSPLTRNALRYVNLHALEKLRLEEVAAHFRVNPNYLSTLVRKETGITYQRHVLNVKMAAAKRMLEDVRVRVEDVAHGVGYENYVSFYNVFKRQEGMTPTDYRRKRAPG